MTPYLKYYNQEIVVLCDVVQKILQKTISRNDSTYHILTELIDDIMVRVPYVKETGSKSILQLFRLLVQIEMYEHANQILYDIINLPKEASINEKPFTYIETFLPEIALAALHATNSIRIPTYIESTVMKYLGSIDWEITKNVNDYIQIGRLISVAYHVENNLYKTLINIVEYDIPAFLKSEDVLESFFVITETFTKTELMEFPIFKFIENYISRPENFTYRSVEVFIKYMEKYRDQCIVINERKLFYPLLMVFNKVYLPRLSQSEWPEDISYPNLSPMLYCMCLMCGQDFADTDVLNHSIITLIKESLIYIDNKETQKEIDCTASSGFYIPIMRILYDANFHNTDLFGNITYRLVVECNYDYFDIEFVKQCIKAIMYQKIVVDYQPINLHCKLGLLLLHIITKGPQFGTFVGTVFNYLEDYWHQIISDRETNRYFLEEITNQLNDQTEVAKYASLIKKANEYTEKN